MHTLTAEQEQAVERRSEPLLLAAGAGSGKTSVLVERFVRAVCEDHRAPERILAITFTERAAQELEQRVRARLLEVGADDAARALERGFIGTFHGFCARLLRANARAAAVEDEHFEILDERVSTRLRRRAFAGALEQFVRGGERTDAVNLIAAYGPDRARATVLEVFAHLRSRGQLMPQLPSTQLPLPGLERDPDSLDAQGARTLLLWSELLERFGERYQAAKRARDGLDFDDLELHAVALLAAHPRLRLEWAQRFELVMVDELQDVNPRQLELLMALDRENLFTVGDRWQSIYGFRHADVGLFAARERQLAEQGQSLRLAHNFRGRGELLDAVNAVFAKRFGRAFTPLRAGRESAREHEAQAAPVVELLLCDRNGWEHSRSGDLPDSESRPRNAAAPSAHAAASTDRTAGPTARAAASTDRAAGPTAHAAASTDRTAGPTARAAASTDRTAGPTARPWREAEAHQLAARVAELVRDGHAEPGQVAILLRGTGDIDCYEHALAEQGLNTLASAGAFWQRQEIADLLAYLRAVCDPLDEQALYGTLASPFTGLSAGALALLAQEARASGRDLWKSAREGDHEHLTASERERLAGLCTWLAHERQLAPELELAQLIERAARRYFGASGPGALPNDAPRRLANVRKLAELAGEWERSEGRDLRGFLDEAALQEGGGGFLAGSEAIAEPDAQIESEDGEAVRLMSVHAAKGLEFDVVCVADLGRTPSMAVPDLLVEGERVGLRLIGLDDPRSRPVLEYDQLMSERRDAQGDEEDRIVYVAMTRARERLLLSAAVNFASWPKDRPGAAPIAWLGPALAAQLPQICHEALADPGRHAALADPSGREALGDSGRHAALADPSGRRAQADPARGLVRLLTVDGTDVALACRLRVAPSV